MKLQFDVNNNVEDFTIILSTRWYDHYGQIRNVKRDSVTCKQNMNAANELSFEVYKTLDGIDERLWNEIVDLKVVWVKELNEYYEINVSLDDSINPVKTITATSLCESELSQVNLYGIEINTTEIDIERDDYVVTKFYDPDNHKGSLLHRILDKAPHYSIKYVDPSLCELQRSFSIDGTSIYDWLVGECAEQFNCLFLFDSTDRSISAYDLYTFCRGTKKDGTPCKHRGEFNDVCPECGSTDLKYYGEDTTIFVDKENLTESVKFETDIGSVKNCFKLEAGDDDMTMAVRDINPNGTDYIYYISEEQKADMPKELVDKIESYDKLVESYTEEYEKLTEDIYNAIDEISYYTHSMMPTIEHAEITASTEAAKLTIANLSPLALTKVTKDSKATTESALKNYAKVYVKTGYVKLEINQSEYKYIGKKSDGYTYGTWTGNFKVTNYSDEEDIAYSEVITVVVNDNYEYFAQQKVMKTISSKDDDDGSIFNVLKLADINKFKEALTHYCLKRLESFESAIDGAIEILDKLISESDNEKEAKNLEKNIRDPYYDKLEACQAEMDKRNATIEDLEKQYEVLDSRKNEIQKILNFEEYLGKELYLIFCSYRREDTYSNDNYFYEGLDDAEAFDRARQFIKVAKEELYKSAMRQHTISSTLYNLLVMPEFQVIVDKFELGNWIRIRVDENIYRLRLISYEINFSDIQTLNVEFSDLTKQIDCVSDIQSVLDSAQSMASNYSYVSKQAEKGEKTYKTFDQMKEEGLNSALMQINNNTDEEITLTENGLYAKYYNDEIDDYDPEQLRVTHNILAFTKDNWKTVSTALGKHSYYKYNSDGEKVQDIAYGLTSDFVTAGYINGSQIIGGEIYSNNYPITDGKPSGSYINLNDGTFNFGGGALKFDGTSLTISSPSIPSKVSQLTNDSGYQNASDVTTITNDSISTASIRADQIKTGVITSKDGVTTKINLDDGTFTFGNGLLTWDKKTLNVDGKITAGSGSVIGGWKITDGKIYADYKNDANISATAVMQAPRTSGMYWVFAAGGKNDSAYKDCPFRVSKTGKAVIRDLTIGNKLKMSISEDEITGDDGELFPESVTILDLENDTDYPTLYFGSDSKNNSNKPIINDIHIKNDVWCEDNLGISKTLSVHSTAHFSNTIRLGDVGEYLNDSRQITTYWADCVDNSDQRHNLIALNKEGKTMSVGWAGTSKYSTKLILHGQTVTTPDVSGSTSTSDERLKNSFLKLDEFDNVYMNLKPMSFKYNNGVSGRKHFGFGAQQVKDSFLNNGFTTKDFGGFVQMYTSENNEDYQGITDPMGLIYTEFVAWNTHMIQKTIKELNETKVELTTLQEKYDNLIEVVKSLKQ